MPATMPKCCWSIVAYVGLGLALGLCDPSFGRIPQQFALKPGLATAVSVNLLMPCAAIAIGLLHGRLVLAWVGAVIMSCGFIAGLGVQYAVGIREWSWTSILGSIPPILVVATLGYACLGSVAVWVRQASGWSRRKPTQPDLPS
jgi:hypothetical protein